MAEKKRRRWWIAILVAAALVTAVATLSEASSNRPLRYYSEDGFTAMTFYTNSSGDQNRSLWGINTDDPQCELDINGTICINRTGVYVYGINLTPGSSGAPTGATYLTLSLDAGLSAERVLTAGNGITFTDTGANGVLRINLTGLQACSSGNVSMWDGSQWNCVNLTTSGSSNTFGYGLNVSGNHITIANLTACNPSTEYSVWDGTEWSCDNDGGGTDTNNYTSNISFNVTGSNYQLNLERVGMSNLTANFTIPTSGSGSGNITGSLVAGEGVYSFNATHLTTNKILYVEPNNGSDIQAKINLCSNDGCLIIIPIGTYFLTTTLQVNKSVILQGQGSLSTILNIDSTTGISGVANNFGSNVGQISLRDLAINNTGTRNGTGLNMSNMLYADIRNIYVNNFDTCFLLPVSNSFYNNLYNPRGTACGTGIQIDGNQNNVFGGRIHTVNKTHYNLTGIGNHLFGSAAETIVSGTIGLYIGSSSNYNNVEGFYAEGNGGTSIGYLLDGNGNTIQGYSAVLGTRVTDNGRGNSVSVIGATTQSGSQETIFNIQSHVNAGGSRVVISPRSNDGTASFVDLFRSTNSTSSQFRIFKGDDTTTSTFRINASDGDILIMGNQLIGELNSDLHVVSQGNGNNEGVVLEVLGVGEILRANRNFQTFINGSLCVNCSSPTSGLDVRTNASFTGNVGTSAGLFSNGSQVCTAANGLCNSTSSGTGNVTGSNGTAGLPAVWSSASNLIASLISNLMIGNKAVNSSQLNTSNAGSSGQYLMLNSTGGMDWNTITTGGSSLTSFNITNLTGQFNASLTFDNGTTYYAMGSLPASGSGSGNITGNITSSYIPYATNNTHFENSRLTQNATANTVAGDWFVNNYVQDRTNQNYMNILETEFCPGNLVNNAPYNGFTGSSISSGIVGSIQANQSHPCILGMGDSTTANGGVMIRTGADAFRLNGTENATFIWKQQATQDQFIRTIMGFFDTSNMAEPTDGCMFYMQMNNHSGQNNQLSGRCVSNSVSRNTSNNYTFTNNTWYITKIEINDIATNVTFKVYNESGSLLWNNSVGTNIPVAVGRETGFGVITSQNNTDASITYMHMDYMGLLIKRKIRSIVYDG